MDCAIYARYSSHNQREESIEDQVRVCREAAERVGDRVVMIYADHARSGREATRRKEFLRMVEDSESAPWKRLYIYKQDRFARDRYDAAHYKRLLRGNGVSIVSVMEPIADGSNGIIVEALMEGLAEWYSANLSENVRRGLEGNALKCKHNGVQLYGYDLGEDGYYHANPDEAPIVRKAFELSAAGYSTGDIEREFASLRTRTGARWTKGRLSSLLKNQKYAGTYVFREHRVEGGMEAIVDMETWMKANARLGKRHQRGHNYELSGKLFDAEGRRFAGVSAKGRSKTYHYYKVVATGEQYPQLDVEHAVYEMVAEFLEADPELREAIAEAVAEEVNRSNETDRAEAEAMRRRLEEIDRESDNLISLAAKTGASDKVATRLGELEEERVGLEGELVEVERGIPRVSKQMMMDFMDLIVAGEAPGPIVGAFVSRVVIDGDDLTVEFNVSEPDGSHKVGAAPETSNRPGESAGSGLAKAVRTESHWLPCVDLIRTLTIGVHPWGFVILRHDWRVSNQ